MFTVNGGKWMMDRMEGDGGDGGNGGDRGVVLMVIFPITVSHRHFEGK